jgi:hyperosmotically inducible periplasmic protein
MKNPQMITRLLAVATLSIASVAQVYAADLKDQPMPSPSAAPGAMQGAAPGGSQGGSQGAAPGATLGAPAGAALGATAGTAPASDATVKSDVQSALTTDKQAGTLKIDVKSTDGVVVLNGAVPSTKAATYVIQLASSVQGVKEVKSELKVAK